MSPLNLASHSDELGAALGPFLDLVPRSGSAEQIELLEQAMVLVIRDSSVDELRQALARVIDWLRYYESWIRDNRSEAITTPAVQNALIRAEMIYGALRRGHRGPAWASRVLGARSRGEQRVRMLTDLGKNWLDEAAPVPA